MTVIKAAAVQPTRISAPHRVNVTMIEIDTSANHLPNK